MAQQHKIVRTRETWVAGFVLSLREWLQSASNSNRQGSEPRTERKSDSSVRARLFSRCRHRDGYEWSTDRALGHEELRHDRSDQCHPKRTPKSGATACEPTDRARHLGRSRCTHRWPRRPVSDLGLLAPAELLPADPVPCSAAAAGSAGRANTTAGRASSSTCSTRCPWRRGRHRTGRGRRDRRNGRHRLRYRRCRWIVDTGDDGSIGLPPVAQ